MNEIFTKKKLRTLSVDGWNNLFEKSFDGKIKVYEMSKPHTRNYNLALIFLKCNPFSIKELSHKNQEKLLKTVQVEDLVLMFKSVHLLENMPNTLENIKFCLNSIENDSYQKFIRDVKYNLSRFNESLIKKVLTDDESKKTFLKTIMETTISSNHQNWGSFIFNWVENLQRNDKSKFNWTEEFEQKLANLQKNYMVDGLSDTKTEKPYKNLKL